MIIINKKLIKKHVDYFITKDGKIWSEKRNGKWLKTHKNRDGYLDIGLLKNGKLKTHKIHRLVAQAFIPNPFNKLEVNHKNGIKTDNRIENLEWCTPKENDTHARKNGLINTKGENNASSKLTWKEVKKIRRDHIPANGIMKRKPWEKYEISRAQYIRIIAKISWKETI